MAFLIGGANSAAVTGYDIDNSLRFNDGDSPVLTDTLGTPTDIDKFTISLWYKRGILYSQAQTGQALISCYRGATSNPFGVVAFSGSDEIEFFAFDDENTTVLNLTTDREFRDPSAWYHIVLAVDTSQGTAANRAKFYINGVQETSFSTATYPDQNKDLAWNQSGTVHYIGKYQYTGATFWDGYMSEFYFIDGQQLTPSDFGETDDDSGIWKPIDAKDDLTFGDNGYYLEFKNSAVGSGASDTIGADTSGNDRHFTSTNVAVTDQTTDTPTNNFATANLLWIAQSANNSPTYSEGNTVVTSADDNANDNWISTIGLSKGKWYVEAKGTASDPDISLGFHLHTTSSTNSLQNLYGFYTDGDKAVINGSPAGSAFGSTSQDDIIGMALDLDNTAIYFHRQGTYLDSGDPTSGASKTGAIITSGLADEGVIGGHAYNGVAQLNFGSPAFAISSGNADANGYGNFEYAVPSGYYALCTKNLAEYG